MVMGCFPDKRRGPEVRVMRNVWFVPDLGSAVERLTFPTTRGRLDYLGFHSTDE
jgi:hypothetical protein